MNYDVHNKELLAIYKAFHIWQHYLDGTALPIDVVTDHKNLEYFLVFQGPVRSSYGGFRALTMTETGYHIFQNPN